MSKPQVAATAPDDTVEVLSFLLKSLDTPYSRVVRQHLVKRNTAELLALAMPSFDSDTDTFRRDWLAYNLVRKATWLPGLTDDERMRACLAGWKEDERLNALTNQRHYKPYPSSTSVSGPSYVHRMAEKIKGLLGPLDLDKLLPFMGFSSGSSTRVKRSKGQPHNKLWGQPHVTPSALPYALALRRFSDYWSENTSPDDAFELVPGGEWFAVPKNAKTFRSCEKQPEVNLLLQKAAGGFIRSRLKLVGIDLNDQSKNQRLAVAYSLSDSGATIDLSSASNSVCRAVVMRLLSPDWFDLLDALRCEWVRVDGAWHRLSMFSSMGNGFTFELESLIFWAACAVTVEDSTQADGNTDFSVYGDDIIVPREAAGKLIELLNWLGFRVNEEKSFVTGPFRESCGVHAFKGVEVTPFYCYDRLSQKDERIRLANRLRHWSAVGGICDERYKRAYLRFADPVQQYRGPCSYGDGHLHSPSFGRKCKILVKRSRTWRSWKEPTGYLYVLIAGFTSPQGDPERSYRARDLDKVGNISEISDPENYRNGVSIRQTGSRIHVMTRSVLDEVIDVEWQTKVCHYSYGGRDRSCPVWSDLT